jgi:hypothetical protein
LRHRGTVYLAGYSFEGKAEGGCRDGREARDRRRRSGEQDRTPSRFAERRRIRRETFHRIYTDDFLSRYAPRGVHGVLQELRDERHFPGMQPVGRYPIHVIVKGGRTMLLGVVDSAIDRQLAEVRAREVTGVFEVESSLTVAQ